MSKVKVLQMADDNGTGLGERLPRPDELKKKADADRANVKKTMESFNFEHYKHEIKEIVKDSQEPKKKSSSPKIVDEQTDDDFDGEYV